MPFLLSSDQPIEGRFSSRQTDTAPELQKISSIYHFNEHSSRYAWAMPFALNPHEADMNHSPSCPRCNSPRIATRDYARKAGGAVGAAAGAAGSAAAALGGAEAGATLGMVAGPVGSIFGGLAGALMGALFGGAAGCAAGSAVGEQIDTNVLNNYECIECGHVFGKQHTT
ncbi:hypothetical protein [Burkholderia pseudomallei]|uniref:hypothetical protein n=2 Tax=Burkholderia pseudomallei TaxID=28450 RepID=UPI001E5A5123|nr:hypothetical protein [Burkholderia pseudomallei]